MKLYYLEKFVSIPQPTFTKCIYYKRNNWQDMQDIKLIIYLDYASATKYPSAFDTLKTQVPPPSVFIFYEEACPQSRKHSLPKGESMSTSSFSTTKVYPQKRQKRQKKTHHMANHMANLKRRVQLSIKDIAV
jgi:hypothetical protein